MCSSCVNELPKHFFFFQVHNFMLGLNLNTNTPFSPFTEVAYHNPPPEEEVDAVTGTGFDPLFEYVNKTCFPQSAYKAL